MAGKEGGLPALSDGQLALMNAIWDEGEATVADVWKRLSNSRPLARNTVQTVMTRLEDKGWLRHRTVGKAFLYSATAPRSRTLRRMVRSLVDTAFRGSTEDLVATLLKGQRLSSEEALRIRRMIERAKGGGA